MNILYVKLPVCRDGVYYLFCIEASTVLIYMFSDDAAEEGEEDDTRLNVAKYSQNERCLLQFMLLLG